MNVLQLLTNADPELVVKAANLTNINNPTTDEDYRQFLKEIRKKVPVTSDRILEISHLVIAHDDPEDDVDRIQVTITDGDKEIAIGFTPWREILGAQVLCEIPTQPSIHKQAAYVFLEMSFYGFEEEGIIAVKDQVLDMVDAIGKPGRVPNKVRTDVYADLFPNASPEELAELRAEGEKAIANAKTERRYKNGVLEASSKPE